MKEETKKEIGHLINEAFVETNFKRVSPQAPSGGGVVRTMKCLICGVELNGYSIMGAVMGSPIGINSGLVEGMMKDHLEMHLHYFGVDKIKEVLGNKQ